LSQIFAFHGVDSKTGTTMISQSVAEWIAKENKECKVLFVSLNARAGTEYVDYAGQSMETLKIFLDNRLLSKREVMRESKRTENLHFIAGVIDEKMARHFSPDAAVYFIDNMQEEFDVIIADTGNDLDNGLAVGALERITNRLLVLTQQESILRRYERLKPVYDKLGFRFSRTIINQYIPEDPYDSEYIAKRNGIPKPELLKVEQSLFARQAEMEYKTLLSYKDSRYKEDIAEIAGAVMAQCGIRGADAPKRKKWISFI